MKICYKKFEDWEGKIQTCMRTAGHRPPHKVYDLQDKQEYPANDKRELNKK